jgi:hypothetical protein
MKHIRNYILKIIVVRWWSTAEIICTSIQNWINRYLDMICHIHPLWLLCAKIKTRISAIHRQQCVCPITSHGISPTYDIVLFLKFKTFIYAKHKQFAEIIDIRYVHKYNMYIYFSLYDCNMKQKHRRDNILFTCAPTTICLKSIYGGDCKTSYEIMVFPCLR